MLSHVMEYVIKKKLEFNASVKFTFICTKHLFYFIIYIYLKGIIFNPSIFHLTPDQLIKELKKKPT